MKLYKTSPTVEFLRSSRDGNTIKLLSGMKYFIANKIVTVPKGFSCDGMSVPRILWGLVSPMISADTIAAAILHDYVYRKHPKGWTRKLADVVFYAILRDDGVSFWRAALAYIGVRLWGKKSWNDGGLTK